MLTSCAWACALAVPDRGGERAAAIYSLIATARLNDVDPRTRLAATLHRFADHPAQRLHDLLPWNYANTVNEKNHHLSRYRALAGGIRSNARTVS